MKTSLSSGNTKFSRAWKKAHRAIKCFLGVSIYSNAGRSKGKSTREELRYAQRINHQKPIKIQNRRNRLPRQTKSMRQSGI